MLVGQLGYPKKECFGKGSLTVITEFQKLDCIFFGHRKFIQFRLVFGKKNDARPINCSNEY